MGRVRESVGCQLAADCRVATLTRSLEIGEPAGSGVVGVVVSGHDLACILSVLARFLHSEYTLRAV